MLTVLFLLLVRSLDAGFRWSTGVGLLSPPAMLLCSVLFFSFLAGPDRRADCVPSFPVHAHDRRPPGRARWRLCTFNELVAPVGPVSCSGCAVSCALRMVCISGASSCFGHRCDATLFYVVPRRSVCCALLNSVMHCVCASVLTRFVLVPVHVWHRLAVLIVLRSLRETGTDDSVACRSMATWVRFVCLCWHPQEYLHAARMYSDKPKSKLTCGAAIFGGVAVGLYIPYFAVQFSLKKAGLK